MDPLIVLSTFNALLARAETLIPTIIELAKRGEISAEQQQEVLRQYQSLKAKADGQFTGPEWQVS